MDRRYTIAHRTGLIGGRNHSVRVPHSVSVAKVETLIADYPDLEHDLKKSLKKIAKKVGLPKERAGELKLAHIRDGGREADIWDGASSGWVHRTPSTNAT